MSTAIIYRPQYQVDFEDNFTALPNSLFNLGRYFDDVKPLHTAVYNYLLSKREKWNIQPSDIAKAQNIGESTARRALTKLRKLGLMSFDRHPNGGGQWQVKVPEFLLDKPQALDKSPLRQKPLVEKPLVQIDVPLVKNDLLPKNEKTTNPVVVVDSVKEVIDLPDLINKPAVKAELSTLEKAQQLVVLMTWKAFMLSGKVKSPVGAMINFAKQHKAGTLDVAVEKTVVNPLEKMAVKKKAFIARNFKKLSDNIKGHGYVDIECTDNAKFFGRITEKDLEDFQAGKL